MNKPTDSELNILRLLFEHGPQTVRQLNDRLNEQSAKAIGYTTTLKFLQIMLEKGLVSSDKSSRTHVYSAAVAENEVRAGLLDRIVDQAFRGSATDLIIQALGQADTNAEDAPAQALYRRLASSEINALHFDIEP